MSWNSYIDGMIDRSYGTGGEANIDKACVFSLDDGTMWTTEDHDNSLKLKPEEAVKIAKMFKSGDFFSLQTEGVSAEGMKYYFLREDDGVRVLASKEGAGALTMRKSKTAILIGHCPSTGKQGVTNMAVGAVADYLEQSGI